jgi:hypothetical protein
MPHPAAATATSAADQAINQATIFGTDRIFAFTADPCQRARRMR